MALAVARFVSSTRAGASDSSARAEEAPISFSPILLSTTATAALPVPPSNAYSSMTFFPTWLGDGRRLIRGGEGRSSSMSRILSFLSLIAVLTSSCHAPYLTLLFSLSIAKDGIWRARSRSVSD